MQDVTHEVVEVGHDVGFALRVNLAHAALEGLQGFRALVLLVVGQSLVVVEHHLVGTIQRTIVTNVDHSVPVHLPKIAAQ